MARIIADAGFQPVIAMVLPSSPMDVHLPGNEGSFAEVPPISLFQIPYGRTDGNEEEPSDE